MKVFPVMFFLRCIVLSVLLIAESVCCAVYHHRIQMFDETRHREIPVDIYQADPDHCLPVVFVNHGYGAQNTEYSLVADVLVPLGYVVVSIQHDLETDSPLPRTGDLFEKRKPIWQQGVKNILHVMSVLKKTREDLNLDKIILIGHSNGGDISMMFAQEHPERVSYIISLDSLRHPFPVNKGIPILRFGAIDTTPDQGVVPSNGVEVVNIKGAKHIDLCDRGSPLIKSEIQKHLIRFLTG